MYISLKEEFKMKCLLCLPDFNSIGNIWTHMEYILLKEYIHITSQKIMKEVVVSIWNNFGNYK